MFTAKVDQHIINFHLPYLKYFKDKGYEVHVASSGNQVIPYADKCFEFPLIQSPSNIRKVRSTYKKIKQITEENNYAVIHCHTPVISVLTRLIGKDLRKKNTKIIYTAHGFHFYKGAPLSHWLIYFQAEKYLSRHTDVLITINEEDYQNTIRYNFKAKESKLIDGVGIDLEKYSPAAFEASDKLRVDYNYNQDDFILIYVAELNANKHQELLIHLIDKVKEDIPTVKLLLVGDGELSGYYADLVNELNLTKYIDFLGFRKDVGKLLKLADVSVSSSKREGLPLNVLEAMAMGKPLVVTNSRGNKNLVENGENGKVVNNLDEFRESVIKLYESEEKRIKYGENGREKVKRYSLDHILEEMEEIYDHVLEGN